MDGYLVALRYDTTNKHRGPVLLIQSVFFMWVVSNIRKRNF